VRRRRYHDRLVAVDRGIGHADHRFGSTTPAMWCGRAAALGLLGPASYAFVAIARQLASRLGRSARSWSGTRAPRAVTATHETRGTAFWSVASATYRWGRAPAARNIGQLKRTTSSTRSWACVSCGDVFQSVPDVGHVLAMAGTGAPSSRLVLG